MSVLLLLGTMLCRLGCGCRHVVWRSMGDFEDADGKLDGFKTATVLPKYRNRAERRDE